MHALMFSSDAEADRAFLRDVLECPYVDDLAATVADLRAKEVPIVAEPADRGFGVLATVRLPSGATLDLYEPRHRTAIDL